MNKLLPIIVAVVSAGGLASTSGCTINNNNAGDGGTTGDSSVGDDGGGNTDTGTEVDSGTADVETDAAAPMTNVRLADWSPDAPATGYDFCVSPHGMSPPMWSGPQLASVQVSLAFPAVTTYFGIDPGQYDVMIVPAGATDCSNDAGTNPIATNLPNMVADSFYTIAFVGDTTQAGSDSTLTAFGFQDDGVPTTAANANVRFINAAPALNGSTTVDFGTGALGASTFSALETAVAFGALATMGGDAGAAPDTNGYVSGAPFATATEFSAHTTTGGTMDTATASAQMVAAGTSATLVLINGKTGGTKASFLVCQGDGTIPASGTTSNCTQVAQ
jgi:hypothetical protein